jgi:hypothetical protein
MASVDDRRAPTASLRALGAYAWCVADHATRN